MASRAGHIINIIVEKDMKRLLISFILLVVMALSMVAQQNVLLRVGGGITSLNGRSTKSIGAFSIGAGYEYEFDQKWSVAPWLVYHSKGWKEKDVTVPKLDDNGAYVYDEQGKQQFAKRGQKSHANYLQLAVPVNYYIHLQSPHYISLSAGPYVAVGIGGKTETYGDYSRKGAERVYYEENTFDDGAAHRFDAGLTVGVGYEYDRHINLGVNADLGLLKVSPAGGRNLSFYLSFMYRL